jgi:hypothetical protein
MTNPTRFIQRQLDRLRTLVPADADFGGFVAHLLDERIASVAPDMAMGIVPPSMLSATQIFASARIATELVDSVDRLASKPEGIVDLGVIDWLLRPAMALKNNEFDPTGGGMWKSLPADAVKRQSTAVCRLDVSIGGSDPIHIGTGFVAGEDASGRFVVATNAHVVEEVVRIGWTVDREIVFACDFRRFAGEVGGERHALDAEYELHSNYDMAFVYLPRKTVQGVDGVSPLAIASHPPKQGIGSKIGVIGHPACDSRLDSFPWLFGFGNEFGVKRFSPGLIRTFCARAWRKSEVQVFLHDATTLSGSSGSCILDLESMTVVGLHFGGWPLRPRKIKTFEGDVIAQLFEANGAVPLWTLRDDKTCATLTFV